MFFHKQDKTVQRHPVSYMIFPRLLTTHLIKWAFNTEQCLIAYMKINLC